MADCSFVRCVQERKFIKRELQKWTKSMVYIVGLERVAEELMGRRKWKLYQEVLARSHINTNSTNLIQETTVLNHNNGYQQQQNLLQEEEKYPSQILENHLKENDIATIKCETIETASSVRKENDIPVTVTTSTKLELTSCLKETEPNIVETRNTSDNIIKETTTNNNNIPVDWKPQDKCYFCVDGKLLTVNEKGDIVAESGPVQAEPELTIRTPHETDSDSSESCSEVEVPNPNQSSAAVAAAATKSIEAFFRGNLPNNMTSFESMAAQLAAVASLQGLQPVPGLASYFPALWYPQLAQQIPQTESVGTMSPLIKIPPSPNETIVSAEQPLDLSAKSSTSSTPISDPKQIFKAKPRMSSVAGRRSYTEEELNNALKDILSGKLGTRRAAVQYNIPRSTLRNKVYKLAMEQKREASLLIQPTIIDQDEDEKHLSGAEEEKDIEQNVLQSPMLTQEDIIKLASSSSQTTSSSSSAAAAASLGLHNFSKLYENNKHDQQEQKKSTQSLMSMRQQTTPSTPTPPPQQQPTLQTQMQQQPPQTNPWLDSNMLLQSLLLSSGMNAIPSLIQSKPEELAALPDLFKNFIIQQQQELIKEQMKNKEHLNNGKPNTNDARFLMQNMLQQHHNQQQQHQHQQHQQHLLHNRIIKSETPETVSSADINDDDSAVILKIPSFKPVAGSSTSKLQQQQQQHEQQHHSQNSTPILSRSPQQQYHSLSGVSPPLMRPNSSDSQSPPMSGKSLFNLREAITRGFSKNLQSSPDNLMMKLHSSSEQIEQYKRPPQISVVKNLGGTDMSRFGSSPNMVSPNSMQSGTGTGGKGTRPKRGKYRNYDRDSLVEAVKAVQRGEMSVHRAGSYYGVPHSTLEYKVKERHLMRPRKREPKPQPLDDGKPSDLTGSTGSASLRSIDKSKSVSSSSTKPPLKTPPFPVATSPNGLKMPMFDPTMTAQLQYSQLFWPHPPNFPTLPMDFTRSPSATSQFPPNAESFFASQMIQKFQEDSTRHTNTNNSSTPKSTISNNNSQVKSARELAESLYDSTNANGSLLDGIIRQSLDRKSDITHGALLDQLVKNNNNNNRSSSVSDDSSNNGTKRSGSPLNFSQMDIKRERTSPVSSSDTDDHDHGDDSSTERDIISKESVDLNLLKHRELLQKRNDDDDNEDDDDDEDLNGSDDNYKKIISDTEDNLE